MSSNNAQIISPINLLVKKRSISSIPTAIQKAIKPINFFMLFLRAAPTAYALILSYAFPLSCMTFIFPHLPRSIIPREKRCPPLSYRPAVLPYLLVL